jgi:trk system potassium uptake protein TrkH
MFSGAMAGSTAGGIKTSRIVIALKGTYVNVRRLINPRYVPKMKIEGKTLEEKTTNDVFSFITLYAFIATLVTLILSFDPVSSVTIYSDLGTYEAEHGLFANLTSAISCLSNIGPGFDGVGAYSSFAGYNGFSTVILTLTMLVGRLEILPVFVLFNPRTWKRT